MRNFLSMECRNLKCNLLSSVEGILFFSLLVLVVTRDTVAKYVIKQAFVESQA